MPPFFALARCCGEPVQSPGDYGAIGDSLSSGLVAVPLNNLRYELYRGGTVSFPFSLQATRCGATCCEPRGAGNGDRTRDLRLGKPTLYRLSYARFANALYQVKAVGCQHAPAPKLAQPSELDRTGSG